MMTIQCNNYSSTSSSSSSTRRNFFFFIILSVLILTSESFVTYQPHQLLSNGRHYQNYFQRFVTKGSSPSPPKGSSSTKGTGTGTKRKRQSSSTATKKGGRRPTRKGSRNTGGGGGGGGGTFSPHENRQLNQVITKQANAQELLRMLASTKGALSREGGGGALNSINFSTSLHRLAKHVAYARQNPEGNDRSKILTDPRFAMLVCSAAEAMCGCGDVRDAAGNPLVFGPRELSNIAWAIAKLKFAPPKKAVPVDASSRSDEFMIEKSREVRGKVLEAAKQRAESNGTVQNGAWVPALSELCGYVMDGISYRVTELSATDFRLQEYANLLWALATAQRADGEVFDVVIESLMRGMQEAGTHGGSEGFLRPQEWSNSIWALATAGITGPEEKLLPFVANLIETNPNFISEFKPQELSNTAWGIATILSKRAGRTDGPECDAAMKILRCVARELIKRDGEGYKSQEIANSVWAFATLGFGLRGDRMANTITDYTYIPSNDPEGDQILIKEAFQVAIKYANKNIQRFRSQELNNFAWAMARFGQKDEKLLNTIALELANPRRRVTSQDIGTSLWSFATLEYFDHDLYRAIAARVNNNRASSCKPQELSNTLWALATADVVPNFIDVFDTSLLPKRARPHPAQAESDPVIKCISTAAQELMRRPQDFKTQEIKDILWALSRMGIRFPNLFKFVAEHLVGPGDDPNIIGRGLEGFSQQGIGNLAWAFARQAQLGDQVAVRNEGVSLIGSVSGRLAHYTVSYIDVGEGLLHKLFYGIAEADLKVHDNLSKLTPQDLANTAWAFAIMGMKHDQFLNALVNQLEERLNLYVQGKRRGGVTWFKGQELANALWALATLNYVRPGLLNSVEAYLSSMIGTPTVGDISKVMKRQELANIAWVSAVFGEYPPKLIELLYMGLLGIGDNSDPNYVQQCYNDGGIQSSAVMSIVYLQTAMDSEVSSNSFSLPRDFPEKWGVKSFGRASRDDMMDDTFELELKSSKIQLAVGSAFDRIGFDHIQEHVISMDALAADYGISVASNPKEILSIDISQVQSKIGIEVDGPGHFITDISNGSPAYEKGYPSMINGKLEYQFRWSNDYQELNGPTALKERILNELGWQMINIPFWSWYALEGNAQKEEEYCQSRLK